MNLLLILSSVVFLTDLLYLHLFAFYKTLGLLYDYNSAKSIDALAHASLKHMLLYWITFVLTSFIQNIYGLQTLRVVALVAMLCPKFDYKKKIYDAWFMGDQPDFEVYLDCVKVFVVDLVRRLKKLE